jgi:hypothetical protein
MKKKLIFLGVFLVYFFITNAQTVIKDKQDVFGTWKKKGSPYIIEGEAIIPSGKVLNIK